MLYWKDQYRSNDNSLDYRREQDDPPLFWLPFAHSHFFRLFVLSFFLTYLTTMNDASMSGDGASREISVSTITITTTETMSSTKPHASQSQLLTKIYYPDTLYPDTYSFFADRTETRSTPIVLPSSMDTNEQYPSVIAKPAMTEIEIIDQQGKQPVS